MLDLLSEADIECLYEKAKKFVVKEQAVAIAMIQVHLRIKYEIALKIVSKLEEKGVVLPINGEGVRQLTDRYLVRSNE